MRYGVLVDIALKVKNKQTIDLTMGHFNAIWQGDANDMILRGLEYCKSPANVLNITGPEILSVKEVAMKFGEHFDLKPEFIGKEAETALLSNAELSFDLFGQPKMSVDQVIRWTAYWLMDEQKLLNKPTHFEVRDGVY
jgi:nucleoside-diphosphate-sugar epimerase